MRSTAHVNGHPIHPMLIPFPFALLTSAALVDVAASLRRRPDWARAGSHLTTAGLGAAIVAAVPGIVDYFGTVPHAGPARETANRHVLSNLSALTCFVAAHAQRGRDGRLPASAAALPLLGAGLLCLGGLFGGQLIYHHHVAVNEPERPALAGGDASPGDPAAASSVAGSAGSAT